LLEEKHKEITDSINYAKRIQSALLTSDEYWKLISDDLFVYFRPKDVVSGDFFWAFQSETKEGTLAIWCAADCTGHGVPGAFMSMLGISFLNEIVVEQGETNPSEILNKLREKIIKALEQKSVDIKQRDGMDMALCVWNKSKNTLDFAGANNPLWLVRNSGNKIELMEFKADKMPVGSYADALIPFSMKNIPIQKGDMVYTFSDGYSDQFGGEKGKKFKESNFKKLLLEIHSVEAEKQKERIHDNFENWKGQLEQIDDVCVIGVRA
jgi:serine phosphatase RsbU (regulator of sigma subunit)